MYRVLQASVENPCSAHLRWAWEARAWFTVSQGSCIWYGITAACDGVFPRPSAFESKACVALMKWRDKKIQIFLNIDINGTVLIHPGKLLTCFRSRQLYSTAGAQNTHYVRTSPQYRVASTQATIHTFLGVNPTQHNRTYTGVNMNMIVLCYFWRIGNLGPTAFQAEAKFKKNSYQPHQSHRIALGCW